MSSDMIDETVELDPVTGLYCTMSLFTNVTNTAELHKKLITEELDCCMVNVATIVDTFQTVVAANKAALNATRNQLVTKNINTEVLFSMSLSDSIACALDEFGLSDDIKNLLVIVIHKDGEEKAMLEKISENVKGDKVSISNLKKFTDENRVKGTYAITVIEQQNSNILDIIVSKISGSTLFPPKNRNKGRRISYERYEQKS
ncbi:PREDICTED: EKC/KEOPS complex subunit TPRKB-like [Trachymyrmex cornetzi]|uniref:TP53RK-binding protein n=1 Tax=Trachymyrmex cornetzi TaxID=471704 RepID=A0A151IS16_9HYME|nr:PREDICTED: EKC/KEOPS complex subunit TPRKB-like [Trachymyrmex cornetzi]XP_018376384.1 PREDICTED: EKC/KEOPS complex subunit TPRKB-like [Trachymyrmex cornetzi]XP_018376385.1 PREDICTED: EKC/KEOPS complex subunit TPRKB-like [Trachymyrmex cornetzi]XP_018376386.1 PREDICTED: EKC/KEOPS complex subunit TPRKB-like [Trachymyrmex cornetzi]XP_018376387.1 PREDICTED: EKC/KEOPS complex subunit TPRKB-like [Trachymyrmex cornetzi]XP_018376388.1 PREDICTED: EKC/KEOPS complex subunit TPRKB-like [Trachymyrmex cor